MNPQEEYQEINDRITAWSNAILSEPNKLFDKITESDAVTSLLMFPDEVALAYMAVLGVSNSIRIAFVVGLLFQRYLDQDNGLADLLGDVNIPKEI